MANSLIRSPPAATGYRRDKLKSCPRSPPRKGSPIPLQFHFQEVLPKHSYRSAVPPWATLHDSHIFVEERRQDKRYHGEALQRKHSPLRCCSNCNHRQCAYGELIALPHDKRSKVQLRSTIQSSGASYPQGIQRRTKLRAQRPRSLSETSSGSMSTSTSTTSVPASNASTRTSDASGRSCSPCSTLATTPFTSSTSENGNGNTSNGSSSSSGNGSADRTPIGEWITADPIAQELQEKLARVKSEREQVAKRLESVQRCIEVVRTKLEGRDRLDREGQIEGGKSDFKCSEEDVS